MILFWTKARKIKHMNPRGLIKNFNGSRLKAHGSQSGTSSSSAQGGVVRSRHFPQTEPQDLPLRSPEFLLTHTSVMNSPGRPPHCIAACRSMNRKHLHADFVLETRPWVVQCRRTPPPAHRNPRAGHDSALLVRTVASFANAPC